MNLAYKNVQKRTPSHIYTYVDLYMPGLLICLWNSDKMCARTYVSVCVPCAMVVLYSCLLDSSELELEEGF